MIMHPQSKLYWHSEVSEWLRGECPPPVLVEIAPSGYCNATCPWCFFKDKHDDMMIDSDIMTDTLFELGNMGVKAINWTGGGEPTLHDQFKEFVVLANNLGIRQGLFTNGYQEIDMPYLFDWIRISVTPSNLCGVKFPKAKFGVCLNQTLNMKFEYMESMCKKAREAGAIYFQVRPALMGDHKSQPIMYMPHELQKYATKKFKVIFTQYKYREAQKPHGYSKCYGYNIVPSIDWRGRVTACLYRTGEPDYTFGDLNLDTFENIWTGKSNHVSVDHSCQNCCKNHEINKALHVALHVEQVDFL